MLGRRGPSTETSRGPMANPASIMGGHLPIRPRRREPCKRISSRGFLKCPTHPESNRGADLVVSSPLGFDIMSISTRIRELSSFGPFGTSPSFDPFSFAHHQPDELSLSLSLSYIYTIVNRVILETRKTSRWTTPEGGQAEKDGKPIVGRFGRRRPTPLEHPVAR